MKYFRNFTLSVLLMLIGTMGIKAQTVGLEEAEQKALAFVKRSNKAKASGMSPTCTLSLAYTSKAGDETYYYVFNNGQDGYVIIGGDEVANDVLGYSESRTFCYDKLPDNM
ncbi:MAG: Spi family protease inhibitor [Bacteroidales bacterium]|nr:Spi family protease inhibitor [Bacteroidales bacterium]